MPRKSLDKDDIKSLYYITHINNVKSILGKGIYSHNKIKESGLTPKKIYDKEVISIRENKKLPNEESLPNYSNLYFQPRNPMLYRVLHTAGGGDIKKGTETIVLLEITKEVLDLPNVYISTGNAATGYANFYKDINEGIKNIDNSILKDNLW